MDQLEQPLNLRLPLAALALLLLTPSAAQAPLTPLHAKSHRSFSSILMWHDVVEKRKDVWFDTTVAELRHQFAEIKRRGLKPVTLETLADHLADGKAIPPKAVVLTFDDNTLGLYRHLFPLLKEYRWPAALFVHTDYVGVKTGKEHCTWEQLQAMERSGLVRCYPHTASHPADMRDLKDVPLAHELTEPLARIERRMGEKRPYLSYSNGFYNERVARAAQKAGYRLAITEDWGAAQRSPNLMMVRRYSMHKRADQAIRDTARGGR